MNVNDDCLNANAEIISNNNFFKVGDTFNSYDKLMAKIKEFELSDKSSMSIFDCKTIETAQKRCDRTLNPNLRYYQIKFCCIHGGKNRKRSVGQRNTHTYYKGCPMFLKFSADVDGQTLKLRSLNLTHNHESLAFSEIFLPKSTKLNHHEISYINQLVEVNGNSKTIQDKILREHGKFVSLKKIRNMKYSIKSHSQDLDFLLSLKNKHGVYLEILKDDSDFKGLFYQDLEMKKCLNTYPEIIFIDATYKLLNCRAPVYFLVIVDARGTSEIVAVGILVDETEDIFGWFIEAIKKHNPVIESGTKIFMTDKDIVERKVLKNKFPNADLQICLYHVLKSFNRELKVDKMNISIKEKEMARKLLQNIAYSKNEEEYNSYKDCFKQCVGENVYNYFEKNWHAIKEQWVVGLRRLDGMFLNLTNNRIECINSKIKQVIPLYSSLEEFFKKFFIFIDSVRLEKDNKAIKEILKTPQRDMNSDLGNYLNHLTKYSFKLVSKEFEKMNTLLSNGDNHVFSEEIKTDEERCNCSYRKSMELPCYHILFERKKNNFSLFDKSLCSKRWSKQYFLDNSRLKESDCNKNENYIEDETIVINNIQHCNQNLSEQKRFNETSRLLKNISSRVAEKTGSDYDYWIKELTKLVKFAENNETIKIEKIHKDINLTNVENSLKENTDGNTSQCLETQRQLIENDSDEY